MADTLDRTTKNTLLTPLAERVMGRWQNTPMTATVQRAIRLTDSTVSTPLTRAAATEGFIQRVTQPKADVAVWKPHATTKQVAIEGFTDALVQRFPDISAKYIPQTVDAAPTGPAEMVYSGGSGGTASTETSTGQDASSGTTTDTFDANKLPSIPADIMARHKAALQKRAESFSNPPSSPTPPAPRAMQRKSSPPTPQLVRPRSKVDYIGSKSGMGTSVTPPPTPTPSASPSEPTSTTPIQAKAEEPAIQETAPLEEPKWRTRPRAGFQSIPTSSASDEGGGAISIPYQPIQAQKESPSAPSLTPSESDGSVKVSEATSVATPPPIQRAVDSTPMQGDETDDDDSASPSGGVLTDEPPPLVPPTTPLQRVASPDSSTPSPEMPLRVIPPTTPPAERVSESESESTLPSLSRGVPAKAIRRTSQAVPILRKPIVPGAAGSQSTNAPSSLNAPVAQPTPRSVSLKSAVPASPTSRGEGTASGTPIQREEDVASRTSTVQRVADPLSSTSVEQKAVAGSLYENRELQVSADTTPPTLPVAIQAQPNAEAPLQRQVESESTEWVTGEANQPAPILPDRVTMPLRTVDLGTPPVQRQAESNLPSENVQEHGASSLAAPIVSSTTPLQRQTEVNPPVEAKPERPVALSDAPGNASVQRQATPNLGTSPGKASTPEQSVNAPVSAAPQVLSTSDKPLAGTGEAIRTTPTSSEPSVSESDMPLQRMSRDTSPIQLAVPPSQPSIEGMERASVIPVLSTTPLPGRDEMPLRVADTPSPVSSAPIQRHIEENAPIVSPSRSSESGVGKSALTETTTPAIQRIASETTPQTITPSETPSSTVSSEVLQPSAVVPQTKVEPATPSNTPPIQQAENPLASAPTPIATNEGTPLQRVVAEPTPAETPGRSDMPLRAVDPISSAPVTPLQRTTDSASVKSTGASESKHEAVGSESSLPATQPAMVQRSAASNATPSIASSITPSAGEGAKGSIAIQPQTQNAPESGTEPLQRVSAEIIPSAPIVPTRSEMPLHQDETGASSVVQHQASDIPVSDVANPVMASPATESVSSESPSALPSISAVESATGSAPVQRKVAPAVPADPTLQRVEAEIASPASTIPLRDEMPLHHEDANSPTVQRQQVNTAVEIVVPKDLVPPSDVTAQSSPMSSKVGSDPIERVTVPIPSVLESPTVPTSTPPVTNAQNTEQGYTRPTLSPIQRVSAENPTSISTIPSSVVTEPPSQLPSMQRVKGDVSTFAPVLPTGAEMPLRKMDSVDTPIQRVAEDNAPTPVVMSEAKTPLRADRIDTTLPIQRVSESSAPTPIAPTDTGMPLRVERVDTSLPVQHVSDDSAPIPITQQSETSVRIDSPTATSVTARTNLEATPSQGTTPTPPNDGVSIQRVRAEQGLPASVPPTHAEMPLRTVETTPSATPSIQRQEDTEQGILPNIPDTATESTAPLPVLPITSPVQRVATMPSDSTVVAANDAPQQVMAVAPVPSEVLVPQRADMPLRDLSLVVDSLPTTADDVPLQRVTGAPSLSEVFLPQRADMPLHDLSPVTDSTGVPTNDIPLQRVIGEPSPSEVFLPQRADMPLRDLSPVVVDSPTTRTIPTNDVLLQRVAGEPSPSESSAPQRSDMSVRNISPVTDSAVVPNNKVPLKRVSVEPSASEVFVAQRADMPLRDSAPTIQRQTDSANTVTNLSESSPDNFSVLADSIESHANPILAEPLKPALPSIPTTESPLQRVSETTPVPTPLVQRKSAVKATRIQRTTNPTLQRQSLPVALPHSPIQRMDATAKFTNPTLTRLPFPTSSASEEIPQLEHGGETAMLVQRVMAGESLESPMQRQRQERSPINRVLPSTDTQVLRRAPAVSTPTANRFPSPSQPFQPKGNEQAEMPLVQRVRDEVVEPEKQEEIYIDLSDHFRENGDASANSNATPGKTVGGAANKEPTESDALKALQTLADEIYPLLRQMIARERERHRGF